MNTVIKAESPAAFLSMVPMMLGFTPENSVAIVTFIGGRSAGVMRIDMPEPENWAGFSNTVLGMVSRMGGVDGLAVIAYTDAEDAGPFLGGFAAAADLFGFRVVDVAHVSSERWASLTAGQSGPRYEIEIAPPEAQALSLPERNVRGEDLSQGGTEAEEIAALLVDPEALFDRFDDDGQVDPIEVMESFITGEVTQEDTATLAVWVSRPSQRDVVLIEWLRGYDAGWRALGAQLAWEDGVEYPTDLARVMWGEGDRPDPDRLLKAHAVLHHLASVTDGEYKVGALSLLAWFSWALGRSSEAERWANDALAIDPAHGLSEIVRSFVSAGHLPDWAFTR